MDEEEKRRLRVKLATVRPGLPMQALQDMIGARWRAPLPHQQGLVRCVESPLSFAAQIDIHSVIRRVQFGRPWNDPPFGADVDIAGLRIGMSPAAAMQVVPSLSVNARKHPAPTSGITHLSDGTLLRLQFLFEGLRVIEIVDEWAVYPPKLPTPYPAPEGVAGGPFADPNLKLVVLESLLRLRLLDLGTYEELGTHVLKRAYDMGQDGYDLQRPIYDYLVRYPLAQADLDAVETLMFDGGLEIYRYIWAYWGGSSDVFDVKSLAGIEQCRNVREVHVTAILATPDLSPLNRLPKLRVRP